MKCDFSSSFPAFLTFFAFSLSVGASTIPHSTKHHRRFTFVAKPAPSNWSTNSLEDYDQYHFRFLSLGCHQKRGHRVFFDKCCHPLSKKDKMEETPVECYLEPTSMMRAQKYILESTSGRGEVVSGQGKPVHVPQKNICVLKPEPGRNASEPPTKAQIKRILRTLTRICKLMQSSNSTFNPNLRGFCHQAAASVNGNSASGDSAATASGSPAKLQTVSNSATPDSSNAAVDSNAKAEAASEDAAKLQANADAAAKAKADAEAAAKASTNQASQITTTNDNASQPSQSSAATVVNSIAGASPVYGQDGGAKGTFFYQGGVAGACGTTNPDSVSLVALPTALYGNGQYCGRNVLVVNKANGKQVVAKVQDMCPGCPSSDSLDLSTAAFNAIGDPATGVLSIEWGFI